MKTHKIAIIGFGTVGGSVGKILYEEDFLGKYGIEIAAIAIRDIKKIDTQGIPEKIFTTDVADILKDDTIDTVVELIGGTTTAKDIIEDALTRGKNIVTANKALLAEYGNELFALAKKNNVQIGCEASICGGIPIVKILQSHFPAKKIEKIEGILNGTCNYMLSELEKGEKNYPEILAQAQKLGFAEEDPTMDVEGIDAVQKLALLAHLSFGGEIPDWKKISCTGIAHLTKENFLEAEKKGKKIRLIGTAEKRISSGGEEEIFCSLSSQLVDKYSKLAQIMGPENAVEITDTYLGKIFVTGAGAGGDATASSVIGDIVGLSKNL